MRLICAALVVTILVQAACASPPSKEMDQAQGAIDAARAAGAERYAPTEVAAATQALQQAHDAVTARDYRLALNYALESREQAQHAARTAADTLAALRGDVERARAETSASLEQIRARLAGATPAQLPRRQRRSIEQTVAGVEKALQEAGAALEAEDYLEAQRLLNGAKSTIDGLTADLGPPATSQPSRRRR